ncbi:ABC transporter ATP-binding protein [Yinghuangia aomiensis]|uniref:ABC transporter ATP-binding protein n=1 Tax=Yinghuangia aomiensis TaxID=676205 RepID=A0ABP9I4R4_9ACTN
MIRKTRRAPESADDPAEPATHAATNLLDVRALTVAYGAVTACSHVSLTVAPGEFVALLGANGAGKSTVLRAVSGLVRTGAGRVAFGGADITRAAPSRRSAAGLAHVPEGRRIFPDLTVEENLTLGAFAHRRDRSGVRRGLADVYDLFPRLAERRAQSAAVLSGGEAQALAVARALMSRPRLLMLDEPTLGLDPRRVVEVFGYLARLRRERGLGILLVEQQTRVALAHADRGYVLNRGRLALHGSAHELARDDRWSAVYLGRGGETPAATATA